ncbi:BspA family leucine-rich repeat surface protein [Aureivirga marina]|uniref:BspA family leucine-rich repeat surface protein n=1 Tax=Aureivirga marina TaxID=1182451 RepID=UPI0018CB7539|nr:BspA family leucine-rich repeat surface protein [Aureivirga marina]
MKKLYTILIATLLFYNGFSQNSDDFIMTYEVDDETGLGVIFPFLGENFTVDLGDGNTLSNTNLIPGIIHYTYANPGVYTITVSGNINRVYYDDIAYYPDDIENLKSKVKSVEQWGTAQWITMEGAFGGLRNLVINAVDTPDLSQVTNMSEMFRSAQSFNQNINNWDVSNVTDMEGLFRFAKIFNQPLNNWDVSNVTNMEKMFQSANKFNQPLDNWDVSNVVNMSGMFFSAYYFNQNINNWDVSNVTNMSFMFFNFNAAAIESTFNQPLNNWDVSNVVNMSSMFHNARAFNQPLNNWDTSNVIDMHSMFKGAKLFNQPLNNWDTSNVTNIQGMFHSAHSFNQNINNWDTSNITSLKDVFNSAIIFNQPLDNWDVSNVTNMEELFYFANVFNQPLNNWDVSNVTNMEKTFYYATVFNQPLDNWDVSNVKNMASMFSGTDVFNQNINNWNVSNLKYMGGMFSRTKAFNQPLNDWDVSNVLKMNAAFAHAKVFNQPLNNWDTSNVWDMEAIFKFALAFNQDISNWDFNSVIEGFESGLGDAFIGYTAMDTDNYDALLLALANSELENRILNAKEVSYCNESVRQYLIEEKGWTIFDGGLGENCNLYSITGSVIYDINDNGCDENDIPVNNLQVNANENNFVFGTTAINGTYNLNVSEGTFDINILDNSGYFNIEQNTSSVTLNESNPAENIDFCITANQSVKDLKTSIIALTEARPGFTAKYQLIVQNIGTEIIENVITNFNYDIEKISFVSSDPIENNASESSLTYEIGTMNPLESKIIEIQMEVFTPPTVNGDDILSFNANSTPVENDENPEDNGYKLDQVVVNSYDPNDKRVMQGEEINLDEVGEYLDYIVRFQNTGTASAINVRILDVLDEKLDIQTLIPISASHDYSVQINGNEVEFIFNNIDLAAEIVNEPESHGYIAFKIKPKNDLDLGDIILGTANIYFDFNLPIVTNTVQTKVVELLSVSEFLNEEFKIFPNPVNNILKIEFDKNVNIEKLSIIDNKGMIISKFNHNQNIIDVSNLNSGIYFIQITTKKGVYSKKWIKE